MDAISLLMADHKKVDGIFQQFKQGGDATKYNQLFEQVDHELTVHTTIEEKIFYPAVSKFPELAPLVKEAREEHNEAKQTIAKLTKLDPTTTEFATEITKLMNAIHHHVQEEETEMFPKVKQHMSSEQLEDLGKQLQDAKGELVNAKI